MPVLFEIEKQEVPITLIDPLPKTVEKGFLQLQHFADLERGDYNPRVYRIERMLDLLDSFGNPHRDMNFIHIAGSKGKGSTALYISALMKAKGIDHGLYMSPHLVDYRERITRANSFFDDSDYLDTIKEILAFASTQSLKVSPEEMPSTFELLTLLAFLIFKRKSLPWAILETGLGGRLDATNVVNPQLSVITHLELEHQQYLGNSLEAIAGEKAGIIKPNIPVLVQPQPKGAFDVLQRIAAQKNAPLFLVKTNIADDVLSKTTSTHKKQNISTAVMAYELVFNKLEPSIIKHLQSLQLPGRFEILSKNPLFVIDGSHTPDSFRFGLQEFKTLTKNQKAIIVLGTAVDKDHYSMLKEIGSSFQTVYITRPGTFKKSDPAGIAAAALNLGIKHSLIEETEIALERAFKTASAILVIGSFHLAGIAKKWFMEKARVI